MYVCPMHPEVQSDKPGNCPKCGMRLVPKDRVRSEPQNSYLPLIVIIALIFLTTLALVFKDMQQATFSLPQSISYFMIGFFLVFSGFKLIDLKGFAEGYSTYDLLAKKFYVYGYIYPFIELFFGVAMILAPQSISLLWAEIVVMGFSGLGVAIKLAKKEKFHCVCLGTLLKVPLTKVTLIEDFGMVALAALLLLFS